jgi:hypothetical protein
MNYETYTIRYGHDLSVADFESIGRHGVIRKRVAFMPTSTPEVFYLAYGDLEDDGEINDYSRSNNGDRNKILATIAKVIVEYTARYPERFIHFMGSTVERTRLYRMAISIHLEELSELFEIYAEVENSIELALFHKNMKVNAFLIKRKNS